MILQISADHKLYGYGTVIGFDEEHLSEVLDIRILDDGLLDKWVFLEFEMPDGSTFTTGQLEPLDGRILYYLPSSLMRVGSVKLQAVLRDADGTVWKTDVRQFEISPSVNASEAVEAGHPDFIAEVKDILSACEAAASEIDDVLSSEADRQLAEQTRQADEARRRSAEAARASAESSRDEAYRAAEESRGTAAEQAEAQRSSDYATAEAARNTAAANAEAVRETIFAEREAQRATDAKASEADRQSRFEDAEVMREQAFIRAQEERQLDHEAAEGKRAQEEAARRTAEAERASAEAARVLAEDERARAETKRQEAIRPMSTQLANLEDADSGNTYEAVTDESVAYRRAIPDGALPYATLQRIGGMTYADASTGRLKHTPVTSVAVTAVTVTGSEAAEQTVERYAIPEAVQSLSGYGMGIRADCCNYIDCERRVFVQMCAERAFASGDDKDAAVLTDGTVTVYPLNAAVETDISTDLPTHISLAVAAGGSVILENTAGVAVPGKVTYRIKKDLKRDLVQKVVGDLTALSFDFVQGTYALSSGISASTTRMTMKSILMLDFDIVLKKTPYARIALYTYTDANGNGGVSRGWVTGSTDYTVPANTYFRLQAAPRDDATAELLDYDVPENSKLYKDLWIESASLPGFNLLLMSKQTMSKGIRRPKQGITYDEILDYIDRNNVTTCTVAYNNAGIKEAVFKGTGSTRTHVQIDFDCEPLKVVVVEFYGKATDVAYSPSALTGGMLIIEFFNKDGYTIGSKYNGAVLGESRCGYHKYGFVSPPGTKTARFRIATRTTTSLTLHDIKVSILEDYPTRHRSGVLLDAHLGLIMTSPQNTMPAFEMAKKAGFSHCVTNCNWTSDGVLVALHNDTIDDTSNGSGNVHELTYEKLQTYDFGSWFAPPYKGTKLPRLEDVVKFMASAGMTPIFRLHDDWSTEASKVYLEQIYTWIKKYGFRGKAVCKSFWTEVLDNCKAVMGNDVEYILCGQPNNNSVNYCAAFDGNITLEMYAGDVTSSIFNMVKDAGISLSAYTVNDMAQMRELINMGITRFTTDTFSDLVFPMS